MLLWGILLLFTRELTAPPLIITSPSDVPISFGLEARILIVTAESRIETVPEPAASPIPVTSSPSESIMISES